MTDKLCMKEMKKYKRGLDEDKQRREQYSKLAKYPLSQFIAFGVVLCVLQILSSMGFVPVSFMTAVGNTLIYAIVAIGFCLLLGYSGLASLGTAGFIGIGVYITYYGLQVWNLPYIVILAIALGVSILLGIAVGFVSLRIEGIYLAIITLGMSEILRTTFQAIKSSLTVSMTNIKMFGIRVDKSVVFILIVVMLILLMWIISNLMKSPTGRAMLAMKNSTSAAQAFGISLMKYRLLAFVISICYASIAGIMYMMYIRSISTSMSSLFTLTTSLNILGAVIIGGYKSLWGALSGIFIIYGMQSMFLQNIKFFNDNPTIIMLFTGVLIILVVMYLPGGLAQLVTQWKFKIKAKRAEWRARKYG